MKWYCQKVPLLKPPGDGCILLEAPSLVSHPYPIADGGVFLAIAESEGLPVSIFRESGGGKGGEKGNDL